MMIALCVKQLKMFLLAHIACWGSALSVDDIGMLAAAGLLLASTARQRLLPLPRSVRLGRRMRVSTVDSIQAIWLESLVEAVDLISKTIASVYRFARFIWSP